MAGGGIHTSRSLSLLNDLLDLLWVLGYSGKVLVAVLGDDKVVFNTHTADFPVLVQHAGVDVLAQLRVGEIWIDDEAAEIDL